MKKGSPKNQSDQVDEHNQPTEPLPDIPAMLFPTHDQNRSMPGDRTVPAPVQPYRDPQHFPPVYPYPPMPDSGTDRYPYPYLPGTPPIGPGTNYGLPPADAAWNGGNTRNQQKPKRTFLPACVGLFFVCVQLLLIVRFAVRLLNLSPDITWVGVVTGVSEMFVLPFRDLWFQVSSVGSLFPSNIEVYTLIAILIYGVLSRLLVRIFKVMLSRH